MAVAIDVLDSSLPVVDHLRWVLDCLRDPTQLENAAYTARLTDSFRAAVSLDEMRAVIDSSSNRLSPLRMFHLEATSPRSAFGILLDADDDAWRLDCALAASVDQIDILFIGRSPYEGPKAPTIQAWTDLGPVLATSAWRTGVSVIELTERGSTTLLEHKAVAPLAVASVSKLWILAAVLRAVGDGEISWGQEVSIVSSYKSPWSGLVEAAEGAQYTVRSLCENLIARSDNTAADHLAYLVGIPAVEAAVRDTGHARPDLNHPFLTTRQMSALKAWDGAANCEKYLALAEAERPAFLRDLEEVPLETLMTATWTEPRYVHQVEWFASAHDLTTFWSWLLSRPAELAEVASEILRNPGGTADRATWPMILSKGGSEPGVRAGTYLLTRSDRRTFAFSLIGNSESEGHDSDWSRWVARTVLRLLASER